MKYPKDAKVLINQFSLMPPDSGFTKEMEAQLKGRNRICRITDIIDNYYWVVLDGKTKGWGFPDHENSYYCIKDSMIAGYAFYYGEKIEVRDEEADDWVKKEFCSYDWGLPKPYRVIDGTWWRFARPLQKEEEKLYLIPMTFADKDLCLRKISCLFDMPIDRLDVRLIPKSQFDKLEKA